MDVKLRVVWFSWMMMVPFLWFVMLARRTFRIPELGGPGMVLGGVALMSGLALGVWTAAHGAYSQVPWAIGTVLAICSVFLYESARRVVSGRGFCVALSGEVPSAVCTDGPYRYISAIRSTRATCSRFSGSWSRFRGCRARRCSRAISCSSSSWPLSKSARSHTARSRKRMRHTGRAQACSSRG